ncbi:MAG TPA: hypothetical protein VIP46_16870 [Pyrinomonadaceae bacterium]
MKAFVCVYRHSVPHQAELRKVEKAAENQPLLRKFLAEYSNPGCFYDWGDDPALFCAGEILGDVRAATWGVCRRDVRRQLARGDLVVFFCGKQRTDAPKVWDYFFVGYATVREAISRQQLWAEDRFSIYRAFYNTLAKPSGGILIRHEPFGNEHKDWLIRSEAPYIIFESDSHLTDFNTSTPIKVATKPADSPFERWHSDSNGLVNHLEDVIFTRLKIKRRLRIGSVQRAHRHISLHRDFIKAHRRATEGEVTSYLHALRDELAKITGLSRAYH